MHSVIIPQRLFCSLCFLLVLILVTTVKSDQIGSVLNPLPSSTGLAGLKEALEDNYASNHRRKRSTAEVLKSQN